MGGAIDVNTHVPATVTVKRSSASVLGKFRDPSAINLYAQPTTGLVTFRVIGNALTGAGSQGATTGITLTRVGTGAMQADIDNNAVWNVGNNGSGASLVTNAGGTGVSAVNVAGNTFDRSGGAGIFLTNDVGSPGGLVFNVFNTIVSHVAGSGAKIISSSNRLVVSGGNNDFYADGASSLGAYSLGSSLSASPTFADEANGKLQLKASSPLIDQGVVCSPAGLAITDAAGKNRLAGKSVDIGAYEHGAPAITGIAVFGTANDDTINGTSGNDILCGMAGTDTINGRGGADYINGGDGPDIITGGPGPDQIYGGPNNDVICSADGTADLVNGGGGTDHYIADAHDTLISVEVKQSTCPFSQ
jgi:hypothetical protein